LCFEIVQEMGSILLITDIVYVVCRIVIKSVQQCRYFLFFVNLLQDSYLNGVFTQDSDLNGVFTQDSDLNDVLTQDSDLNDVYTQDSDLSCLTQHLSQNPV
jgi:hypothetical protein